MSGENRVRIAALPPPVSTGSGSKGLSQSLRIPLAASAIIRLDLPSPYRRRSLSEATPHPLQCTYGYRIAAQLADGAGDDARQTGATATAGDSKASAGAASDNDGAAARTDCRRRNGDCRRR